MTAHARPTDWQIFQLAASGLTPAQVAARTGGTEASAVATIRGQAERQREYERQPLHTPGWWADDSPRPPH